MKKWIFGIFGFAAFAWLVSLPEGTLSNLDFWKVRRQTVLFTGFVTYVMMAWVLVLSLRLSVVEGWMGGLDRVYRLHKWLGISACSLGGLHWAAAQVPKWLVRSGILERPARHGKAARDTFLQINWKDLAETVGEWAFYLALVLIIISLVKRIPYHQFRRLHKFIAPAFLVLTFHALILMPLDRWLSPAGILGGFAVIAGSLSALCSLFGGIGAGKKHKGIVKEVTRLSRDVLHVTCGLEESGLSHTVGQFAFVRFKGTKDPHPFTISSTTPSFREIGFHIKVLGDDTAFLMDHLEKNTGVQMEGPYGRFNFFADASRKYQIWVGAGIGVTPFLARMQALNLSTPDKGEAGPEILFYYCSQPENALLAAVEALARPLGIRFEIYDEEVRGYLTLKILLEKIPDPKSAQLWFCGPLGLGAALERDWKKEGLSMENFHREYFQMR